MPAGPEMSRRRATNVAVSARPYSFMDDAPLEERRTQAVYARRATEPASGGDLGALDPDAIAQSYLEVLRQPRSAWSLEVELRPWVDVAADPREDTPPCRPPALARRNAGHPPRLRASGRACIIRACC